MSKITIASDNISFIGNSNTSIIDTAASQNIDLESGCEDGDCGVCQLTLESGQIVELKPQMALSPEDKRNKQILACCCAPRTDISLGNSQ